MNKPSPVAVAFGWSRDETAFISNAIRFMTRKGMNPFGRWAQWSHMFLVFRFADGSQVIHEALASDGWRSKDYQKLPAWKKKDTHRHHYAVRWLPVDPEVAALIYQSSLAWVGAKSYAKKQLMAFAIAESVIGRALGLSVAPGPNEVICSEGACRLVGTFDPKWDLRRYPDQSWDSISPQAAYNAWLWRHARLVGEFPAALSPSVPTPAEP